VAGQNWYGYCGNSPLSYRDPMGWDAIFIAQTQEVSGLGHAGALIEDEDGYWNFFYWGTDVKLDRIDDHTIVQSPERLNEYLAEKGWLGKSNLPYDGFTYIPGDFSKTLEKYNGVHEEYQNRWKPLNVIKSFDLTKPLWYGIKSLATGEWVTNGNYNLVTRNCVEETIKHLGLGVLPSGMTVRDYMHPFESSAVIPNEQLAIMQELFSNKSFTKDEFIASIKEQIRVLEDPNIVKDRLINPENYERYLNRLKQLIECPVD